MVVLRLQYQKNEKFNTFSQPVIIFLQSFLHYNIKHFEQHIDV